MSESNRESDGKEGSMEEVARLIRRAGRRPRPETAIEQAVLATLEREWRKVVRQRRRRRWLSAAAVAISISAIWGGARIARQAPPEWVGTMVSTRGPVQLTPTVHHDLNASGDVLAAGTRIQTGSGGGALLSIASIGVRIGANSVVDVVRRGTLRLERGFLYVDGGPATIVGDSLQIDTDFGTVTHHGTQYQLQSEPGHYLFAAVREGRIEMATTRGQILNLKMGDGLRVYASHEITRETLAPYSPEWQWVSAFTPDISIDGRPLSAFFDWFARETGRSLVFVPPATRDDAERTLLSGSVAGLTPGQALDAVLATSHFQVDLSTPGELRILAPPNALTQQSQPKHGL